MPQQQRRTGDGAPPRPPRTYTCAWCGTASAGADLSCPACGAPVDVSAITSPAGWEELPGIKNMAKLQFGHSTCQIEGAYVPVADMNLAAGESVFFPHHVLLWKDADVDMGLVPMTDPVKRELGGMSLYLMEATGPGHIAFSMDTPGELIPLPIQKDQAVDVREHIFMVGSMNVDYGFFNPHIWFGTQEGTDSLLHFPLGELMDRFFAEDTPGLVLLHGAGNIFLRRLSAGESVLVKPTSLMFKDVTVEMQLHIERPHGTHSNFWSPGVRHIWLRLTGPGRVAIQSAFKHMEDNGRRIVRSSPATKKNW